MVLWYTEVFLFQEVRIHVYRGVFISGGWNRGVPLCTEVSFGIKEFHCIQRCSYFRVLE